MSQEDNMPKPGIYRHYKGHEYNYIGIAKHSETLETLVIYQRLDDLDEYWVRPKDIFEGNVIIDEVEKPRFEWIRES